MQRLRSVLPWVLFVAPMLLAAALGVASCGATGAARAPLDVALDGVELAYELRRTSGGVEIRASARCPAGETEWSLPQAWGGDDAPDRDLGAPLAFDGRGRELAVEPRSRRAWVVRAPAAGAQSIAFRVAPNPHRESARHTDHYRPIVAPDLVHLLGGRAIVVPSSLPRDRPLRTRLVWRGFDAPGWRTASSFGAGADELVFEARADELQHAVYVGGALALERREVRGRPVFVAVHGTRWTTPAIAFADLAARVVELERAFFDDWDYPHYLISLIEAGPGDGGSQSIGGTGLHDSFAMFVSPGTPLAPEEDRGKRVVHVLAHEMFHHWAGGVITPEAPEELSYWFTEGFTDYFTRRLLHRAGIYSRDEFAADLNEKLGGYYASPVREAPAERIRTDFWNDAAVAALPYQRGDAIAVELDHAIRRASGGARTIDDWMRGLERRYRALARPFTQDELFDSIEELAGRAAADELRAVALDGKLLAPREDWFAPCLRHEVATRGSFELGFDFDATRARGVITGLCAGSAAERAGLREGDAVAGWSVALGDAERTVELTLQDGEGSRRIEFLPRSGERDVPAFRVVPGAACGPQAGL